MPSRSTCSSPIITGRGSINWATRSPRSRGTSTSPHWRTEVDWAALRQVSPEGGRQPIPTETMVRNLVLMRLYSLPDEQMEYELLDRMSYQRFCGLNQAVNIPDCTSIWTFENRIVKAGAHVLFDGVSAKLLKQDHIVLGGLIIYATLVPEPKQSNSSGEEKLLDQGATPANWKPATQRQKDQGASWTKRYGKSHFGYKLLLNVDNIYQADS